jgi:hypothetical protein
VILARQVVIVDDSSTGSQVMYGLISLGTIFGRGIEGKIIFMWVLHKYGVRMWIRYGKISSM